MSSNGVHTSCPEDEMAIRDIVQSIWASELSCKSVCRYSLRMKQITSVMKHETLIWTFWCCFTELHCLNNSMHIIIINIWHWLGFVMLWQGVCCDLIASLKSQTIVLSWLQPFHNYVSKKIPNLLFGMGQLI